MERFEKENIKEQSKKKWGDDGQAFPWFDEKYQFHICTLDAFFFQGRRKEFRVTSTPVSPEMLTGLP